MISVLNGLKLVAAASPFAVIVSGFTAPSVAEVLTDNTEVLYLHL